MVGPTHAIAGGFSTPSLPEAERAEDRKRYLSAEQEKRSFSQAAGQQRWQPLAEMRRRLTRSHRVLTVGRSGGASRLPLRGAMALLPLDIDVERRVRHADREFRTTSPGTPDLEGLNWVAA